jgi:hypothetical protein
MIGVITSEKSGSFERMGMKLYIWMRPGLIPNHATDYMWLPVDGSDAPKIHAVKG